MTTNPEVVFNRTLPLDNVIYRLSYISTDELNPSTIKKENFSVYDVTDNTPVEIEEVLYEPLTQKVTLVLNPQMVYNLYTVEALADVKSTSGADAAITSSAEISAGYEVEIGGAAIKDIAFYSGEAEISRPSGKHPLFIKLVISNSSPYEQKRALKVYLNDDEDNPIILSHITLNASGVTELIFGVLEREYGNDVINVSLK